MVIHMHKSILFVGTSTIDHIALVKNIPTRDERIAAKNLIKCGGGPAANAAAAAKALGANCSIISVVGADEYGKEIVEDLQSRKINTEGIQISSLGHSPTSLIQVEENSGLRTITHFGGVSQYYDFTSFPIHLLKSSSVIHADGNFMPLTLYTFKKAKKLDIITSLDGGNISKKDLNEILPYTDVFITDIKSIPENLKNLNHVEICKEFTKLGPSIVGITKGENGCILFDSKKFYNEELYKVKVVDTTGAGDNFHGAFAFGLWKGLPLDKCLKISNVFAAHSCKGLGGRGNLLDYESLKKFL